ncbi:MAG: CHASE3 domain-containing protein [Thaumarchaeota archaeon]|nr:CHASE3 domain-containing protein [Nitrososphaerota archaeon]
MKFSDKRFVIAGFIVGLALVILLSLETFQINNQYELTVNDIVNENAVQANLSGLLTELDNAESGQRGYVITGNASYLQPYQSAIDSINGTTNALRDLVGADSNLSSGFQQIRPLIQMKLLEMKKTIDLRQTQGFAAAQAEVNTNLGESLSNQIRGVISGMNAHVVALQSQGVSLAEQQGVQRADFAFIVTIFAAGLLALAGYSVYLNLSKEEAARIEADRSRKRAELMQDILVHDIRNYNQISKGNAEMLESSLTDEKLLGLASSILNAIDGSTDLIRRTRALGNILSQKDPVLETVSLKESFERSLELARKAFPDRTIEVSPGLPNAKVVADGLLDEVFINILTNAAKYTDGPKVSIDVILEEVEAQDNIVTRKAYWKMTIADHGRGISDDMKKDALTRYMGNSKGRGLGLSIVRALVVDRYSGRLDLRDRSAGDHTKGTTVEIWLPKSP